MLFLVIWALVCVSERGVFVWGVVDGGLEDGDGGRRDEGWGRDVTRTRKRN